MCDLLKKGVRLIKKKTSLQVYNNAKYSQEPAPPPTVILSRLLFGMNLDSSWPNMIVMLTPTPEICIFNIFQRGLFLNLQSQKLMFPQNVSKERNLNAFSPLCTAALVSMLPTAFYDPFIYLVYWIIIINRSVCVFVPVVYSEWKLKGSAVKGNILHNKCCSCELPSVFRGDGRLVSLNGLWGLRLQRFVHRLDLLLFFPPVVYYCYYWFFFFPFLCEALCITILLKRNCGNKVDLIWCGVIHWQTISTIIRR